MGVRISLRRLILLQAGRCPAGPHKSGVPGSMPGPGTAGGPVLGRVSYARRRRFDSPTRNCRCSWHGTLTGIATRSRAWCLWVRIPPVLLTAIRPVVQRPGRLSTHRIAQVRVLPGRLSAGRSAGVPAAHLRGKEGDRVRFSGGPLWDCRGDRGSVTHSVDSLIWAAGPTGRHRHRTPEIGVRLPGGPLGSVCDRRAHGPRG